MMMDIAEADAIDTVEVASVAEWRDWLIDHHSHDKDIWLLIHRDHHGDTIVPVHDLLDEALCFGWTDGRQCHDEDESRMMLLMSPPGMQPWVQHHKDRIGQLTEAGRMEPAGQAAVMRAKENGSWYFMDDVDALIVPGDLVQALAALPDAISRFGSFSPSSVRDVLCWIKLSGTPETRALRVAQTATLAATKAALPQI